MEKKQYIEAGRIVNTHGVAGEVKIEVWLDVAAGEDAAILGAQGSTHHKVAVRHVSPLPGRKGHPDELLLFFQSQFCHSRFSFFAICRYSVPRPAGRSYLC